MNLHPLKEGQNGLCGKRLDTLRRKRERNLSLVRGGEVDSTGESEHQIKA